MIEALNSLLDLTNDSLYPVRQLRNGHIGIAACSIDPVLITTVG
jgi:hypothetical protein